MNGITLATMVLAGSLCLPGCGRHTTAAEIDGIVAEARSDAARDLAASRNGTQPAAIYLPGPPPYALQQAEADYGIAFARCRSASGPARRTCKHAAEAALAVNSANAGAAQDY